MDDDILGLLCACVVPSGGLVVVIAAIALASRKKKATSADLTRLELRVASLEQAQARLAERLGAPEPELTAPTDTDTSAPADGHGEQVTVHAQAVARGKPPAGAPHQASTPVAHEVDRSAPPAALGAAPVTASSPADGPPAPEARTAAAAVALEPKPSDGPTPPPRPPAKSAGNAIAWERWIGVVGAAALGALVLVLAGVFFFQYSIEHGLITPPMRVVIGTLIGVACVAGSEWKLRQRYAALASWIAGAGIALLYLSFWGATARYHLIPQLAGFVLMAMVTAASGVLAVKRHAMPIAVLGLVGGFATPILLSTGSDRPVALFSYLALLNAALWFVAHRRKWPLLVLLGVGASALYQAVWFVARMGDRIELALGIVMVFAVLFAFAPKPSNEAKGAFGAFVWNAARLLGLGAPFLFTLFFAVKSDLGPDLYLTGGLTAALSAMACWVGRREQQPLLAMGAASSAVAVLAAWLIGHAGDTGHWWQAPLLAVVVAAVFHVFLEAERKRLHSSAFAALASSLGFAAVLGLAATFADGSAWPWIAALALLSAMLVRHGTFPGREALIPLAAAMLGLGLGVMHAARLGDPAFPSEGLFLGTSLAAALSFGFLGVKLGGARAMADHGAGLIAVLLLLHQLALPGPTVHAPLFFVGVGLLAVLSILAAMRRRAGTWLVTSVIATALVCTWWSFHEPDIDGGAGLIGLGAQGLFALGFAIIPAFAPSLRQSATAWRASAVAGPALFFSLKHLYEAQFGAGFIAILPLALAAVSVGAASLAKSRGPAAADTRKTSLVWLLAAALGFVALAVPLQLDNEWVTIAWSLQGVAVLLLWQRLDHAGLKYFALALLATVTVRLVLNLYVLDYHTRSGMPGLNWLTYTYLVPALCLLGGWYVLRPLEAPRRRTWESALLPQKVPVFANALVVSAIAVVFVWLNLTIFDIFATGPNLTVPTEHEPARDLTVSIVWAAYAVTLLGMGMWRASGGLRWLSLGLVLITVGKVFLYDLSHLRDLYRVGALVGLAVSLILIAFAYQRFVFRKKPEDQ